MNPARVQRGTHPDVDITFATQRNVVTNGFALSKLHLRRLRYSVLAVIPARSQTLPATL